MSPRKRRKFTTEQKATAVEIAKTSGKPIAQIAREMDLTESALRQWIKQAQIDQYQTPQGPLTSQERSELQQLRRDLKRAEMERDFLTAGALSGGTPPPLSASAFLDILSILQPLPGWFLGMASWV